MEEVGARIEDLWKGILDVTSKLVIPDWASLIALLPILLLVLVVGFFVFTVVRFMTIGPSRRGIRRLPPVAPPGVHAGSGSFAPILAAAGAFLLFFGLIVKGWFLVGGLVVLILTLLYWGREAMTDYEHVETPQLPAGSSSTAVALAPPPGVHLPAPTFRPILASVATALLLLGLIAGPAVALAGLFALVVVLIGWLRDARREYSAVVVRDRTGHPPADDAPGYPMRTLGAIGIVLALALVLNTGLLPPKSGGGTSGAGASPGASSSGGGSGGGGSSGSGGSGGGASGPAGDVTIEAKNIAFVQQDASAPANKKFTLAFDNEDSGTPHNVAIHKGSASGPEAFRGEIFPGPKVMVYDVPPLDAGTYAFVCSVHPNMTGTLTVR